MTEFKNTKQKLGARLWEADGIDALISILTNERNQDSVTPTRSHSKSTGLLTNILPTLHCIPPSFWFLSAPRWHPQVNGGIRWRDGCEQIKTSKNKNRHQGPHPRDYMVPHEPIFFLSLFYLAQTSSSL